MPTLTTFLQLSLPFNGEFNDTWDAPLNSNFTKIDAQAKLTNDEIIAARFSKSSLANFLSVSIETDGTLKPTEEVLNSRSSPVYDFTDGAGDFTLDRRLELGDREVFDAREGYPTLRDAMAGRTGSRSQVLSGFTAGSGLPAWMGFTAANVQIDGASQELYFHIDGKTARERLLRSVPVSGAIGVKFIYATYSAIGQVRLDRSASTNGTAGSDGSNITIFEDLAIDFTLEDILPGDILRLTDATALFGEYVVKEVAPSGNSNRLKIIGLFSASLGSLNYTVSDPIAPTYGSEDTKTLAAGKIHIGEADFDGGAITAVRPRNFGYCFTTEWRAVDVSGGSPTFEEAFNHYFGSSELDIMVEVSQANNDSLPVEHLSPSAINNSIALNFSNTLSFNPGTSDASLTGTVTSSLIGNIKPSAKLKWNTNTVTVKNVVSAVFYEDYNGAAQDTGFIRLVIKQRM